MKRFITLIALVFNLLSNAQITLDHTFSANNTSNFIYTDIGNNDYKYIVIDYTASKVDMYNLDYSPYLLNISTPMSLQSYEIGYITKNLFDCDDTNVEFLMYNLSDFLHFYIYRTDGTILFQRDNVVPYYCFGCNSGSIDIRPIIKTPNGTKLILTAINDGSDIYVYNLCGDLPLGVNNFTDRNNSLIVFPDPGSNNKNLNFKLNLPANSKNIQIEVYDLNMKLMDTMITDNPSEEFVKKYNLASGVYFYRLKNEGKVIKAGKFIIK